MSDLERGEDLTGLIDATSRQLRRNTLVAGSAWLEVIAVGWLLLAVIVDMLIAMPVPMRVAAFAGFWLMFIATLALAVVGPMLRRPGLHEIALRIERAVGGMHNRLVTVLDLGRRNGSSGADPRMARRLVQQTRERMAGYRVDSVADPRPMRRGLIAAGGTVLLAVAMVLLFSQSLPTALARIVQPTADIPPATWLRIEAPGDQQVLIGEPLMVHGRVLRGQAAGMVLRLRPAADPQGAWIDYPMAAVDGGGFEFEIPRVAEGYEYRLAAGRTWTPSFRIQAIPRPIVEEMTAAVILPPYMGMPEPRPVERGESQILAPLGARVRLSAVVAGEPVYGDIVRLQSRTTDSVQTVEREVVWFDDELPADAVTHGRWVWSASQIHSGLRAHTFNWDRQAYGFRTRLNQLDVPGDGVLFTYAHLDPQDPPQRIVIQIGASGQKPPLAQVRYLVWGGGAEDIEKQKPGATRHLGPLPPPGQWTRLEAPVDHVFGLPAVKLSGMAFEIDTGRATFDRSGYLLRRTNTVSEQTLEPVGTSPMALGQEGRWIGEVEIREDVHLAVRFYNKRNDPSRDLKPLAVLATPDQPPTVTVERPGGDVVLAEAAPLPLLVRAFDDWGLEAVGLEMGSDPQRLEATQWLEEFDQPRTSRMLITSIDPRRGDLKPGQTLHYQLVARDRKGQETRSELYKLTIAAPEQASQPNVAKKPSPLDDLKKGLDQVASALSRIAEAAEALIPDLAGKPDATLSPQEIQRLAERHAEELDAAQRQQLAQADRELDASFFQLNLLANLLERAAAEADQSPLASPLEGEALREMADRAAEMAAAIEKQPAQAGRDPAAGDRAALERLLNAQQLAAGDEAPLPQLQRQLGQLDAAREEAARDPAQAEQQMAELLAEMQARHASQSLGDFEQILVDQRENLGDLRARTAELERAAAQVDADALPEVQEQHKAVTAKAEQAIRRSRDLLDQPAPQEAPPDGDEPVPPLQQRLTETEQELDETIAQSSSIRQQIDGLRAELSEQAAREEADDVPAGARLRELLTGEETQRLLRLARRAQLMQSLARNPSDQGEDDESGQDGEQAGQRSSRAARGKPGQPMPKGAAMQSQPGTRSLLLLEGAQLKADAADRAAVYRLPPRLREPLIQGMQERGPQGYQPLIDAYYRQLSREIE